MSTERATWSCGAIEGSVHIWVCECVSGLQADALRWVGSGVRNLLGVPEAVIDPTEDKNMEEWMHTLEAEDTPSADADPASIRRWLEAEAAREAAAAASDKPPDQLK